MLLWMTVCASQKTNKADLRDMWQQGAKGMLSLSGSNVCHYKPLQLYCGKQRGSQLVSSSVPNVTVKKDCFGTGGEKKSNLNCYSWWSRQTAEELNYVNRSETFETVTSTMTRFEPSRFAKAARLLLLYCAFCGGRWKTKDIYFTTEKEQGNSNNPLTITTTRHSHFVELELVRLPAFFPTPYGLIFHHSFTLPLSLLIHLSEARRELNLVMYRIGIKVVKVCNTPCEC